MNTERWRQIENILFATFECEHAKRAAVLECSCAGDDDLRREVESLLAHHAPSETYIETPAFLFAAGMLTEDEVADDEWQSKNRQFGAYKIIREIGRGGMGAVFLAERTDGEFQQNVALKIIRHGFADVELARRFRQER